MVLLLPRENTAPTKTPCDFLLRIRIKENIPGLLHRALGRVLVYIIGTRN